MEDLKSNSSSSFEASSPKRRAKWGQTQPFRLQTQCRGEAKQLAFQKRLQELIAEEAKHRIRIAQGLPLTTDKPQVFHKPPVKEQTKPVEVKLHTQRRAMERAIFNYMVACKISWLDEQRKQLEKLQKMIDEEEVKTMRKEMVPKAQLMPLFDRPFIPQRSTRPLTVPKEPCFRVLNSRWWRCNSGSGPLPTPFHEPLS